MVQIRRHFNPSTLRTAYNPVTKRTMVVSDICRRGHYVLTFADVIECPSGGWPTDLNGEYCLNFFAYEKTLCFFCTGVGGWEIQIAENPLHTYLEISATYLYAPPPWPDALPVCAFKALGNIISPVNNRYVISDCGNPDTNRFFNACYQEYSGLITGYGGTCSFSWHSGSCP